MMPHGLTADSNSKIKDFGEERGCGGRSCLAELRSSNLTPAGGHEAG